MRRFIVDLLPWKSLHDVRDIVDTIYNTSLDIFESKKRALLDGDEAVERQVGEGKDILSILSTLILFHLRDPSTDSMVVRANMDASEEDKLDEAELVAQVGCVSLIFASNINDLTPLRLTRGLTFAAVDTTSNAISRTLHLLAEHQHIQEKLRLEIAEARAKTGSLAYDELVSLPYLDAVCRESLRLYPPVSYLSRTYVLSLRLSKICR